MCDRRARLLCIWWLFEGMDRLLEVDRSERRIDITRTLTRVTRKK